MFFVKSPINKKSRKTPEGINRLLYLVKLVLKLYQQLCYLAKLYEQGADHRRIGQYVRNWLRWVRAGVGISVMNVFTVPLFATIVPLHAPSE